jgi:hypothetical protein
MTRGIGNIITTETTIEATFESSYGVSGMIIMDSSRFGMETKKRMADLIKAINWAVVGHIGNCMIEDTEKLQTEGKPLDG